MSTFVDTGVLFAAAFARDRSHARAVRLLRTVEEDAPFCSDHVVVEVFALLRSRSGWEAAKRFWSGLRETALAIEPVGIPDLARAEAIATEWADHELDIVDCTSFAVMERLGCRRAAAFDRDFAIYRYGPRRDKAFDVIR